jgi:hypothetical protein
MAALALTLDVVSNVLVVAALIVGWRSLSTAEDRVRKKYADFAALRADLRDGRLTKEQARKDRRNLPDLTPLMITVEDAPTTASKIELSIYPGGKALP